MSAQQQPQRPWSAVALRVLVEHKRELDERELHFVRSMAESERQPSWSQSVWLIDIDRRVSAPLWDGMA